MQPGALDEEAISANSFRPRLVGSLMMTGAWRGYASCTYVSPSIHVPAKTPDPTGARVRLISTGGAHSAAVVEPSTGEEKGREEEEGLKAMYGASPTLSPGTCMHACMHEPIL